MFEEFLYRIREGMGSDLSRDDLDRFVAIMPTD